MAKRKSPHTQTQQDTKPEQTDLDAGEEVYEADTDEKLYSRTQGAETGMNRSPREVQTRTSRHRTEPEVEAHEGAISTRVPKRPVQGITPREGDEAKRQKKVVERRPDAQAGVNHSR
jgi:hypothetical protein